MLKGGDSGDARRGTSHREAKCMHCRCQIVPIYGERSPPCNARAVNARRGGPNLVGRGQRRERVGDTAGEVGLRRRADVSQLIPPCHQASPDAPTAVVWEGKLCRRRGNALLRPTMVMDLFRCATNPEPTCPPHNPQPLSARASLLAHPSSTDLAADGEAVEGCSAQGERWEGVGRRRLWGASAEPHGRRMTLPYANPINSGAAQLRAVHEGQVCAAVCIDSSSCCASLCCWAR